MGQNWVSLVTKNAAMEVALMKMEDEIRATAKKLRVDPGIENVAE
jgi:hypothetical protein